MRTVVVLVVAAVLVLAGCTGGGPAADDATVETTTTAPGGGAQADGGDGTGGDGADGGDGAGSADAAGDRTWEFMRFSEPARYTFELRSEEEPGVGTLVWDVTAIDGDAVTVTMTYEMGETRTETTVSGDSETVRSQLMMTPAGPFLIASWFSPMAGYYEDRELAVGEEWSYSTPRGSASFAVTGTETMAGVECYRSEMQVNGSVVYEGCFAPDLGVAPYTAYHDEDGTRVLAVELVAYERR